MKKVNLVVVLLMLTVGVVAQEEMKQKFIEETRIEAPVFIGETKSENPASQNFTEHLQKELKYLSRYDYLEEEGIVAVDFIVEADGSISNIMISNSVSQTFDEAVLKVVNQSKSMWRAGKINGVTSAMDKTVYVKFDIPGNASHNEIAIDYLDEATHRIVQVMNIEGNNSNEAMADKKTKRKVNSAQKYLSMAEQYKPNDASITFWQAKVFELKGQNDLMRQHLDEYLDLVRHIKLEESLANDILLAVITLE
ncbi:energy transducer TonB [Carboxylicivirga marina]|uniref:Energy transducer TonB n=1 Tax=Carboxylicivirga marina TaxID=2800988 RepID=A0ABS1HMJ0_9BACT|nr:energy transducer TonB [Carboxylicivirga marina]MBK3518886.1 energy transducer TonB [Carboxylicivirga marina]